MALDGTPKGNFYKWQKIFTLLTNEKLPDVSMEKMNKIVAVKCPIDMDLPVY